MLAPTDTRPDDTRSRKDTPLPSPRRLAPLPRRAAWYDPCKRAADLVLALLLLVATAPLLFLGLVLVKLTSRGPVFYTQTRVGRGGRPFTLYKLRTMIHQCESLTGPQWSRPGDPRVTPVGRFLRRTHLDELPQLWNILKGEMSLNGPRPERPEFVPQLEQAVPHYRERLRVRPGLTGLAQVQLPPDTDLESVRLKLAYDLYYVRACSLWLDVRLLLCTALKVCGVPGPALRVLFRIPRREAVLQAYRALSPEPRPAVAACVQPA
jgi:lipopolysaccharide/colanic/teichoic acid biosynthesis glycosyltransferase